MRLIAMRSPRPRSRWQPATASSSIPTRRWRPAPKAAANGRRGPGQSGCRLSRRAQPDRRSGARQAGPGKKLRPLSLARQGRGQVGPDLSGVNNKTKEELLNSILNPSAAIEPRFIDYLITTKDGRLHDGVIGNETPGMITLRNGSEEGDELILRSNIAEMRASSVSLMPEDLEQSLSKQDLADVIAYLRGGT